MLLRSNQLHSSFSNLFWKNKSKDEDFICDVKKNPNLKKLIRYDGNFNNKRKVEFESAVAGILRTNPAKIKKLVNRVSRLIWPEIEDAFLRSNNSWLCQHMVDVFYEKDNIKTLFLIDSQDIVDVSNIQDNFYKWMHTILNSKRDQDVYKQLEIINRYAHFFLKPFEHMAKFKKLNNKLDIETVPDGVGKTVRISINSNTDFI